MVYLLCCIFLALWAQGLGAVWHMAMSQASLSTHPLAPSKCVRDHIAQHTAAVHIHRSL